MINLGACKQWLQKTILDFFYEENNKKPYNHPVYEPGRFFEVLTYDKRKTRKKDTLARRKYYAVRKGKRCVAVYVISEEDGTSPIFRVQWNDETFTQGNEKYLKKIISPVKLNNS